MTRAFRIFVLVLVVVIALLPLVESFDRWDGPVLPTNDTELSGTYLLAGVGMILLLAQILRSIFRPSRLAVIGPEQLCGIDSPPDAERCKPFLFLACTIPLRI